MNYCHAILPSAGLGNKLFPWARCQVYARRHNLPILASRWSQLKIGPLLRGEKDSRIYFDLFRQSPREVGGFRRYMVLRKGVREKEPSDLETPPCRGGDPDDDRITIFSGSGQYFSPLLVHRADILEMLLEITQPRWLDLTPDLGTSLPIAIHVRRGDFRVAKSQDEFFTSGSLRTPIEWFAESLSLIRERAGTCVGAYLVSDGPEDELRPVLTQPLVKLVDEGSAIANLLALSKASLLIGSGGSSYTAWAAFLGQQHVVTHPGQSLSWYGLQSSRQKYVGEFDPSDPSEEFFDLAFAEFC